MVSGLDKALAGFTVPRDDISSFTPNYHHPSLCQETGTVTSMIDVYSVGKTLHSLAAALRDIGSCSALDFITLTLVNSSCGVAANLRNRKGMHAL